MKSHMGMYDGYICLTFFNGRILGYDSVFLGYEVVICPFFNEGIIQ